jgi:hypothetical protein
VISDLTFDVFVVVVEPRAIVTGCNLAVPTARKLPTQMACAGNNPKDNKAAGAA